jgi:hypothetical protein
MTSIIYNNSSKLVGLDPYYYRYRGCDTNLTANTPANQYQRLKLIQNTVRVYSSLYTMNVAALSAYRKPSVITYGVCWNQMSDRPFPSVQKTVVPTGYFHSLNNRHYSVTSSRPGGQSPGGVGCDIKHNSYDRYLNRLKGKGPLRLGVVPPKYGEPYLPFNPAFPIYGGKTIKTNIVNGCNCPIDASMEDISKLYVNSPYIPVSEESSKPDYYVGENVYAIKKGTNYYSEAVVIAINPNNSHLYDIQFEDGTIMTNMSYVVLLKYYPCSCASNTVDVNGIQVDVNLFIENFSNSQILKPNT